jgi:hypothetical protein
MCLLKKLLYGLKQSSRWQYKRSYTFMLRHGYIKRDYDSCVLQKALRWFICILVVVCWRHVDCLQEHV